MWGWLGAPILDNPPNFAMQEVARLVGAPAVRKGHPIRQREHGVDQVPWNGLERHRQLLSVALGIEAGRAAQDGLNDDIERRSRHCRRSVDRCAALGRAPTLDLALRHRRKDRDKREERLVPKDRRHGAALPAPVGAFGKKKRVVADHRRERPAGDRVAAERSNLFDQNFPDDVGLTDQQEVGHDSFYPGQTLLVAGARDRLDIVAP